jgi:predicted permease
MNWRRFFRRAHADREQQQELESYIDITAEEYLAQGMSPEQAWRAARRKLGNLTRIREEVYDMNTATFFEGTLREFRHAARMLRLNPAFSVTAVLTLALGIGATTAMFSVVHGVVIKPLPYPDADAVVTLGVSAVFGTERTPDFPLAPRMFASYAENGRSFQEFGLATSGEATVTGLGTPEHTNTLQVTRGILTAVGVQPVVGRWFSPEDDRPGTPETVILSNGYWQRRFGGDPGVIGSVMTVDSRPREVIGVMPAGYSLRGFNADLIFPLRFDPDQPPAGYCCRGIARLKPGATLAQANADVARMIEAWKRVENRAALEDLQLGPAVRPLKDDVVGDVGRVLWVLMGSIGILLLIACANVANLLLLRVESRGQELAIRTAPAASVIPA